MLFFSITGALTVLACGIELSRRLNKAADRKLDEADKYVALLRYIRVQIDCFVLPIGEILKRADRDLLYGCGWIEDTPPETLYILFTRAGAEDSKIQSILLEFCEDFGKSYIEDQIRRCDDFIDLILERRATIAKELPSKKKLNSTLCVSGSLALIILLI